MSVTPIDTGEPNQRLAAIEAMKRDYEAIVEQAKIVAKIRKASYDAHIEEGFSPAQALRLCMTMSV
jgi:hypothetical protein